MSLRRLIEGVERSNDFLQAQAAWEHRTRSEAFYKKYGRSPETTVKRSLGISRIEVDKPDSNENCRQFAKEEDITPSVAMKKRREKKFGIVKLDDDTPGTWERKSRRHSYSPDRRGSRSRDRKRTRVRVHCKRHSNGRRKRRRSHGPPMRFPTPPRVLVKTISSNSSNSDSDTREKPPNKELADSGEALAKNPRILNALAELIMQRRGLKKSLPIKQEDSVSIFRDHGSATAKYFQRRRTVDPEFKCSNGRSNSNTHYHLQTSKSDGGIQLEPDLEKMKFTTVNEGPLHKPKLSDIFERLEETE